MPLPPSLTRSRSTYHGAWRDHARATSATSTRPIRARVIEERERAIQITTGIRTAWLPKRSVTVDAEAGIVTMSSALAAKKLLD